MAVRFGRMSIRVITVATVGALSVSSPRTEGGAIEEAWDYECHLSNDANNGFMIVTYSQTLKLFHRDKI